MLVTQGLSERRALTVVRMSASALRYVPRPDPDPGLRARIVALAHRHRRYGAGMIYLKLRQEGRVVNHITSLEEAQAAGRLQARLKILTHPALLVVDEIGYLPITRTGAMLYLSWGRPLKEAIFERRTDLNGEWPVIPHSAETSRLGVCARLPCVLVEDGLWDP